MASNFVYNLQNVNLSINGISIDGGGAPDNFIEVTMPKRFEHADGVHGDSVSVKTGASTATFRLTLLESHPVTNDIIDLIQEDIDNEDGRGVGEFLLENIDTGKEISGSSRFDGHPNQTVNAQAPVLQFEGRIFLVEMRNRPREEV